MKNVTMKLMTTFATVSMLAATSGCLALLVGAGAGVAGTAYYQGKLTGELDATPAQIKPAAEAAFKELKITKTSTKLDALELELKGKTIKNDSVYLSATLKENGQSKLGIRIGSFGDQALSEKIYAAIDKRLPKKKK